MPDPRTSSSEPAADLRWTWATTLGPRVHEHALALDAGGVTLVSSQCTPSERRWAPVEAFCRPDLIAGLPPETRFALVQALAERISADELHLPRDRSRHAFWQHYDRARVHPETFAFVVPQPNREPVTHVFRLDGLGLHIPASAYAPEAHYLPDDVFVHGPPLPATPLHARATLRRRLFEALRPGHPLRAEHSFPRLDHARMAPQRWTWNPRSDGETILELSRGSVLAGYVYGHDMGYTEYAPERVLSGEPRVHLSAPAEVERELLSKLTAALLPSVEAPTVASTHPSPALLALRRRVVDRAPWNHSTELVFDDFLSMVHGYDWADRAALGLYASLRPDTELPAAPLTVDEGRHQHSYNWKNDRAWLAPDGSGVLVAMYCFGGSPGDGVNDVFHILPVSHRRVVFEVCTDSTQNTLDVTLSVDDPADLEPLCDEVEAYFRGFGLGPAERCDPGTHHLPTDARSVTL